MVLHHNVYILGKLFITRQSKGGLPQRNFGSTKHEQGGASTKEADIVEEMLGGYPQFTKSCHIYDYIFTYI